MLKENLNAINKFQERLLNTGRSKATVNQYTYWLNCFFEFNKKKFSEITAEDIDKFIAFRRKKEIQRRTQPLGQGKGRISSGQPGEFNSRTLNSFYCSLRTFYSVLGLPEKRDLIVRAKNKKTTIKIIEKNEIKKIFENPNLIKTKYLELSSKISEFYIKRDICLIYFIFSAGTRIGETVKIKESDLKLERKVPVVFVSGKSGERFIELSFKWLELFNEYKNLKPSSDYLFCSRTGQALALGTLKNIVRRLTGYSPHKFRHAFAVFLLEQGKTIKEVSEALGHSKIETTSLYLDLIKNPKKRVGSPLDSM